jgi:hypothetical protein
MGKERDVNPTPENAEPSGDKPATGFPEPPGSDPGDISQHESPHHVLNTPVGDPDPTEWPDPYEVREDPLAPSDVAEKPARPPTGATSNSEPHPEQDPQIPQWNAPDRDQLDE